MPAPRRRPAENNFAGRLGGNQEFILDRSDPRNAALLEETPDAAPSIPLQALLDPKGFRQSALWKAAVVEGIGTMILTYISCYMGASPSNLPPPPPSPTSGVFSTPSFIGPLVGGLVNVLMLTMLIYTLGPISGAHLNPFITLSTFMVRLTTLPRTTLYVAFQLIGASIAGLFLRASFAGNGGPYGVSYGDFKVPGCFLFFPDEESHSTTIGSVFVVEFLACLTIIFLAFGLGLDPRQRQVFGPTLAPLLVGLGLGTVSLALGFAKPGFAGPSINPARCFGAYVGSTSGFPGWHWVHWAGPIGAGFVHACLYAAVPPWTMKDVVEHREEELRKAGALSPEERAGGVAPSQQVPIKDV